MYTFLKFQHLEMEKNELGMVNTEIRIRMKIAFAEIVPNREKCKLCTIMIQCEFN